MISKLVLRVSFLALFVAVGGCSSSSVSDKQDELIDSISPNTNGNPTDSQSFLRSQAIDGYIVGADVYCDEQRNGLTEVAGWLACGAGTDLISVEGGRDVGFDETAATGGIVFNGKLQAPGGAPYITPLTTIATLMSVSDGVFDRSNYDASVERLGERLGLANLDLTRNPVTTVELARANAQINALAVQFATTASDYELAISALAHTININGSLDLTDSVANVSAINEVLRFTAPHLVLSPVTQAAITEDVDAIITAIEQAELIEQIDAVVANRNLPVAFSIDRTAQFIEYSNFSYYDHQSFGTYSLFEFEQDTVADGNYLTKFDVTGGSRNLGFYSDAFIINRSLQDANVNVAIDVQSVLDSRRLSVTIRGVQLSMLQNNSRSIRIQVPEGTVMHATYIEENGVVTNVSNTAAENLIASSSDGNFSVNLSAVEDALRDNGYANFFRQFGDYRMTLVLDGINFNLVDFDLAGNAVNTVPSTFTVDTSADSISGLGLQGFLSLVDNP